MLSPPIVKVEQIGGGHNSRVFRLSCEDFTDYVGKLYFQHPADKRNRLDAEFTGLQFLWKHGTHSVPRPIAQDVEHGAAIYTHIDGEPIPPAAYAADDLDQAVEFLARLKSLTSHRESRALPSASEACFSPRAIIGSIEQRFQRLAEAPGDRAPYQAMRRFLVEEFEPSFETIQRWVKQRLVDMGTSLDAELPHSDRTLSPSDFGFHNALRTPDGTIVFLDFEYFGWDDPAKMISDFLLHPAMSLSENMKVHFAKAIFRRLGEWADLPRRVEVVYPLFGLKWCLIILNEFIPVHYQRRDFASSAELDQDDLQLRQSAKAQRMLGRIWASYEEFPYYA